LDHADGKLEDVESGRTLNVLVTDDALIAFGLCRDFCERGTRNPYKELDVDLFLISSCGNPTTMRGHIDTAQTVRDRYRAASFVVQQRYPSCPGIVGYVLAPTDAIEAGLAAFECVVGWVPRPVD
jgi:hypothetical protein